jgi:sugar transferase (PEP-CTERM/EpsH1 system associated)
MRGEILFLAHRIPFPPNRGDKIRSHHILRRLAQIAPVHVGCFADDAGDWAEEAELARISHSFRLIQRRKSMAVAGMQAVWDGDPISRTAFYDADMATYVDNVLAYVNIAAIYVFSSQMGQYVPDDFAGRVIMDFVDVDSAKFEAYAAERRGPMGWVYGREGRMLRAEEAHLAQRADVSLLVSEKEAELFAQRLPEGDAPQVLALGNGIDAAFFDPTLAAPEAAMVRAGGPRLIFTGQMDYPPNIAAVERVAKRILPLVRERLPEASFHIVGRAPTDAVWSLGLVPGVRVWGPVKDVRGWLKGADMALCPLEIARGVQNKVLEAMAMELPVVLSSAAATGIEATPGVHFAVADEDAAIAEAIVELARDGAAAARMGRKARGFVVEKQSWQGVLAPLAGIMAMAADGA